MELKKMIENGSYDDKSDNNCDLIKSSQEDDEEQKKKNEIKALWKDEINGIDSYINNINSIKTTLVR